MKRKLLILGGSGFIGTNLRERFLKNPSYEVYATYRDKKPAGGKGVQWVEADLTVSREVTKAVRGMDVIIQAAATTSGARDILEHPYLHVTDNAVMNALLFRACFEEKVKHVIFFSCTTVYLPQEAPVKEEDLKGEVYGKYFGGGWTKIYNEKMCEFYSRISETKYAVIRHSNIYGPHDKFDLNKSHVFGATVTKVLQARENEKILVWGDGSEERDLLYIDDLLSFVEKVLEKQQDRFELVNVGRGINISIKELNEKIIAASGKNLGMEFDPSKPSIGFNLKINCDRARKKYGWTPEITLDEGIRKTLAWVRSQAKTQGHS